MPSVEPLTTSYFERSKLRDRESAQQSLMLWEASTVLPDSGLLVIDEHLVIKAANDVAKNFCQLTSPLVGRSLRAIWKAMATEMDVRIDHVHETERWLVERLEKQTVAHRLVQVKTPEEERWWKLTAKVHSFADQEGRHLVIRWRDVTEEQRQEESLQRQLAEMADQSRQWQAIYMNVQESIVLLDLKGRIMLMNPATEEMTKHKGSEMIHKPVSELFPKVGLAGGSDEHEANGFKQTVAQGRPSDLFEAIIETKDKRHIWINYTYTPLRDASGKMLALVRVTSDVTQVKSVEQMKNDFVSIASHELRTPLGVMNGYLNLFLSQQLGPLTDDQLVFMERLYHASNDMAMLVEDLLNMSRIEAGRLEVMAEQFDLAELTRHIITELEPRFKAKRLQVKLLKPGQGAPVLADKQKIGQALTNVIDNAIKYTYDGGVITITVRRKQHSVDVAVKDSGVGIKPNHLNHIFEKFYRENNPLSIKEGGSGLGLYITRKLLELHGGSISATSEEMAGSTFTVSLPLFEEKE